MFVRQSTKSKKLLNKAKYKTSVQQTLWEPREGIALHKPGVCEAKHANHKLLTTKACNKLREPKGKH